MTRKINNSYELGQSNAPDTGGDMLKTRADGTLVWEGVADTTFIPYSFQGSNYGFSSGGHTSGDGLSTTVNRFSFSSNVTATDWCDLYFGGRYSSGGSSSTHGYSIGAADGYGNRYDYITKFSFTSTATGTDVGNLSTIRHSTSASCNVDYAFNNGGLYNSTVLSTLEKVSFSSDGDSTSHGDLAQVKNQPAGFSASDYGYAAAGQHGSAGSWLSQSQIDKYAFSSNTTATDVGDLSVSRWAPTGCSSSTHGFASGGNLSSTVIDKFSFSSEGTAASHGNLINTKYFASGSSSTTEGFTGGGGNTNSIEKYSYSSNTTASDWGDLSQVMFRPSGTQY